MALTIVIYSTQQEAGDLGSGPCFLDGFSILSRNYLIHTILAHAR